MSEQPGSITSPIMTAAEAMQRGDAVRDATLPAVFANVVRRFADHTAVRTADHHWTYAQLDAISTRAACAIGARGRAGRPVCMLMDQGAALVAAIIGALKAGRPYVVLDPDDPPARHHLIVEDVDAGLIVADRPGDLEMGREVLTFDSIDGVASDDMPASPGGGDIAVITYTSGTTGAPKGVMQSHRNIVDQVARYHDAAGVGAADRFALITPCSYAASLSPMFTALLTGGALLPFDLKRHGVESLAAWLAECEITVLQTVPTAFRALGRQLKQGPTLSALRLVRLGGEAVSGSDLKLFRNAPLSDACRLMVGFSSTETGLMLYAIYDRRSAVGEGALPVHHRAGDITVRLVDEHGGDAPVGTPGRLVVSGRFLSPGYWGREDLTAGSFGEADADGVRTYDTGDLARVTSDGGIVLLGRADRQVKIHGHRIELDEVETAMRALPGVSEAAVVLCPRRAGGTPRLIGFVVAPTGNIDWRDDLSRRLPVYMMPARMTTLRQMPLLPNGKVDREQLRALTQSEMAQSGGGSMPRAEFERRLVRAWEQTLDVGPIALDDDFFDLGGDSIQAATLALNVDASFGRALPPATLIEAPTVRQYADRLARDIYEANRSALVRVRAAGTQRPIFCIHALDGGVFWAPALAQSLSTDHPIFALQSPALFGDLAAAQSMRHLAAHYVDHVRSIRPDGDCALVGYCMGGMIALEMAHQLQQRGCPTGPVVLIDTPMVGLPPTRRERLAVRVRSSRLRLRRLMRRLQLRLLRGGRRDRLLYSQSHRVLVQHMHHVLMRGHVPPANVADVIVLKAEEVRYRHGVDERERLIESLQPAPEIFTVGGDHITCMREPNLSRLAETLCGVLERWR